MKAQAAYDSLRPQEWAQTSIPERLHILEQVQDNMVKYADELAAADGNMKNEIIGEDLFFPGFNLFGTIGPIGNVIGASVTLYEGLLHGKMLEPTNITQITDDIYDIQVSPHTGKEKLLAGKQTGHLRVKGEPKQINPMDKPAGVIAVSGAGNYSSSLEMVKAIFWENKAVIHKPHKLNVASDEVWQKIFEPLIAAGAMAFADASESRAMAALTGLDAIYFTGSTGVAHAIQDAASAPLISECGGNNPCIIVPGDRPWTEKEIRHQAIKIASVAKMNGGAVCGRTQTLVTSKNWDQREAFLEALRVAIRDETFANGTYYPGSDKVKEGFLAEYPNAENLSPENGKYKSADVLLITDVAEDGYAVKNEAFCQIIGEVPLDTDATASDFLPKAVEFCNTKLLGSLGCMVLIDDDTQKNNTEVLETALTNLSYGGISVNTIPPMVFFNPYLTWGGCGENTEDFVSGVGNFGNVMNFENIEKSILRDQFIAPGDMLMIDKESIDQLSALQMQYTMKPTWINLMKLVRAAIMNPNK